MDARAYWNAYVKQHGGPVPVHIRLGIPYSTIAGVCNGSRGIGHDLASRMAKADPLLDAAKLVWVRPIPPAHRSTVANREGEATETDGTSTHTIDDAA